MSVTNPPSDAPATSLPSPTPWHSPTPERDFAPARRLRIDSIAPSPTTHAVAAVLAWIVLASGFVIVGGGNLDPAPQDAWLGLAAGEGLGPLGQVYGGWDPALWPAQVVASQVWAWGEGGTPSTASIRWPAVVATVALGLIVTLRLSRTLGRRAGLLGAICLFGSVAMMHRTLSSGLDPILGLAVVGALDRILGRGSDWVAGLWAALAVLAGGWPPLAMILLPIIVLGRPGRSLSHRLLIPPVAAFAAWSAWAIPTASAEAWGAALALPLTQPSAWFLVPSVLLLGLPWTPLAALAAWPSVRGSWTETGRSMVLGWVQVAGVAALAGTLIPGLAVSARMTALVALAVVAAASLDGVWSGQVSRSARRGFQALALLTILGGALGAIWFGGYLAVAISYYRTVGGVLAVAGYVLAVGALAAAWKGADRWVIGAVVGLAVFVKVAHWGVFVPEWNYRFGQGAWGRAIGQWVVPNRTIYMVTPWPHHLMFHTERPVRQLAHEYALQHRDLSTPQYLLLHEGEFTYWPSRAPRIVKVREFRDERGRVRILARTEGELGIQPQAPDWVEAPSKARRAEPAPPQTLVDPDPADAH